MKKVFLNIAYVFMAAIFLIASTGFSYVKHYCNISKTEHIKLFTDNYKCKTEAESHKKCCCSKHHTSHQNDSENNLKKSNCCNNTYQYLKIPFQFDKQVSIIKLIVDNNLYNSSVIASIIDGNKAQDDHRLYQPPPLLFFGNYLIHFTHNLKIPSPTSC